MVDECLTKPCAVCGEKITGANWGCRRCSFCVCLTCGTAMSKLVCPKCGRKLE